MPSVWVCEDTITASYSSGVVLYSLQNMLVCSFCHNLTQLVLGKSILFLRHLRQHHRENGKKFGVTHFSSSLDLIVY